MLRLRLYKVNLLPLSSCSGNWEFETALLKHLFEGGDISNKYAILTLEKGYITDTCTSNQEGDADYKDREL